MPTKAVFSQSQVERGLASRPTPDGPPSSWGRLIHFLHRRVREVRDGGVRVLLQKGRAFPLFVLQALAVLVIRALRPLVLIRFAQLKCGAFGHFTIDPELYLCERDLGMHPARTWDIFYYSQVPPNDQLRRMWERVLWVFPCASRLDRLNRILPGYERHVVRMTRRDARGLLAGTRMHLAFTDEEERVGAEAVQSLGIPDDAPFVCFNARDPAFYDSRVFSRRKKPFYYYSGIQDYLPAAEELTRRGYFALRMGAIVSEPLTIENRMIIDYAKHGRNDFTDIFLGAKCRFFVSNDGLASLPRIFRRPVAITNAIPLEYAAGFEPQDLFIPKKLWLREERRFLTFREILESGLGRILKFPYDRHGIDVVHNTPEEITALAVEMEERLSGTWQTTEEEEELQRRFWSLWKPGHLSGDLAGVFLSRIGTLSRISTYFLRQNLELLE